MNPWIAVLFVWAWGLTSCGKTPSDERVPAAHAHHPEETGEILFEKGSGLKLSQESLEAMGVKTEEVEERLLTAQLSSQAQIYRSAEEKSSLPSGFRNGFAYASAPIPVSVADCLDPERVVTVRWKNGEEQNARLMKVDDALRIATDTVEALLEIPDPSRSLSVGSFVQVEFSSGAGRHGMAIPASALLETAEGRFVYVKNGTYLLRTAVQTAVGSSSSDRVEIIEGLLPGDVIVTSGAEALHLTELRATKGSGHSH